MALRTRPIKGHVFAGLAGPFPFEPKGVGSVQGRSAPRRHAAGSHLSPGRIVRLTPSSRNRGWPGQRLGLSRCLTRYLDMPMGEVGGDFELDRRELHATDFAYRFGDLSWPS